MKKTSTLLICALFNVLILGAQNTRSIYFKENKGQVFDQNFKARPDVLFSGTNGDLLFHLKNNGISYQLRRVDEWIKKEIREGRKNNSEIEIPSKSTVYRLDINWLNCNSSAEIKKGKTQAGFENYYLESCPGGALEVKNYEDILYKNLYPGIDLKWYEKNGSLEYDYYVAPYSDYKNILLSYEGAESISIDAEGNLIIKTPLGIIKEQKPLVLQNNKALTANWSITNNQVSFDIKNANPALELIIDPAVRLWATYYGGTGNDDVYYTYSNAIGEVFISGSTHSNANMATSGAHQTIFGGSGSNGDGYLVKFDPSGARLWATYYGGSGDDYACESICDGSGNVFMTGGTKSSSPGVIATPGSYQPAYATPTTNPGDAFLVMFNSSGVRQWATYYGGNDLDFGNGISLDNSGNIFIVGATQSTNNIASVGSQQPALYSGQDAFLAKFNSAGVRQWGTYFGGNAQQEIASDCVTNASGDTYITGATSSTNNISTPGCHQAVYAGGPANVGDAYLAKFNSAGVLQWGTYYGGSGPEFFNKLSLDATGDLYAAGWTSSSTSTAIATVGSHQANYGLNDDAMLVRFNAAGQRIWGTYYGGNGSDYGGAPTIDASGNVYLSGDASTFSGTNIATACAYQAHFGGGNADAFLAKFSNTGRRIWGTYYGGIFTEYSYCSSADASGNIYMCGMTNSNSGTVISTLGGFQPAYGGGNSDAFLVKFDGCVAGIPVNTTPANNLKICSGNSTTLSATCGNWYSSATSTNVLIIGDTFTLAPLTGDTTLYVEDFGCGSVTATRTAISVSVVPSPTLNITNSNPTACVGETITLSASGASTYSWTTAQASSPTLQVLVFLSATYTVNAIDANGCKTSAIVAVNPNLCLGMGDISPSKNILIYPNPTNGAFHIEGLKEMNLILSDETGRTLKKILLTSENNFTFSLSDLPSGLYFLSGEKDKSLMNKKIVVIGE